MQFPEQNTDTTLKKIKLTVYVRYFVEWDKSFKNLKYKRMLISDGFLNSNCCKKKIVNYKWNRKSILVNEYKHEKYRVISSIICVFYFAEIRHPIGKDIDATTGADKFSKT